MDPYGSGPVAQLGRAVHLVKVVGSSPARKLFSLLGYCNPVFSMIQGRLNFAPWCNGSTAVFGTVGSWFKSRRGNQAACSSLRLIRLRHCLSETLPHGVTVALQILVLSVKVRILVG